MTYTDKMGKSWHISDSSAYKESIDVIERTDTKDFIHLVTMQNHIAYRNKYDNPSFDTTGTEVKADGDGYMEDLHNSDKALEQLIDFIDDQEEDFLLVFWGDHLPGIYPEEITNKNSELSMRETPLFFYSNKHDLSGDVGTISPVFYLNHILEILDMKVTPHEALINDMEQVLPGLLGGLYLENNSEEIISSRDDLSDESRSLLKDLDLLQYDIVSGSQYAEELGFFEIQDN